MQSHKSHGAARRFKTKTVLNYKLTLAIFQTLASYP